MGTRTTKKQLYKPDYNEVNYHDEFASSMDTIDADTVWRDLDNTISGILSFIERIEMKNGKEIRFYDADNSHYVGLKAPYGATQNTVYQLPPSEGLTDQVLTTDGASQLSWKTPAILLNYAYISCVRKGGVIVEPLTPKIIEFEGILIKENIDYGVRVITPEPFVINIPGVYRISYGISIKEFLSPNVSSGVRILKNDIEVQGSNIIAEVNSVKGEIIVELNMGDEIFMQVAHNSQTSETYSPPTNPFDDPNSEPHWAYITIEMIKEL